MNKGGRPCHELWDQAYFQRQYHNNKIVAFCLICEKTLSNTARSRLQKHRLTCTNDKTKLSVVYQNPPSPQIVAASSSSISTSAFLNGTVEDTSPPAENVKYMFVVPVDGTNSPVVDPKVIESLNASLTNVSSPSKKRKADQRSIDTWVDCLSETERKKVDRALIQFFYSSNIGMDLVASPLFLDFVKALRPSYKPPTEDRMYELLDELLDEES